MIRRSNHGPSTRAQRAREEVIAARENLRSAAEHGAQRVGDASRRTRKEARDRAARAAKALRGERPPSLWRWLGVGLAAGAALGAAIAATAKRWREPASEAVREKTSSAVDAVKEQTSSAVDAVKEQTSSAVDAVKERTSAAAHRAAEGARSTVTKARSVAGVGPKGPDGAKPRLDPDPTAERTSSVK
jgi:ElaB/YqjD/DUF883 family membrane-anchored ribosome-binding protein